MKGTAVHCAVTEYESPCGVPSKHQQIPSLDAYGVEAVDLCGTGLHATYFPFASGITPSPTLVPIEQSPHDTINGLPVLAGMDALRKRLRSGVVEPEVDDEERPRAPRTCSSCKNRQPAGNFKGVHATCQPCIRHKKAKRDSKVMALKSLKRQAPSAAGVGAGSSVHTTAFVYPPAAEEEEGSKQKRKRRVEEGPTRAPNKKSKANSEGGSAEDPSEGDHNADVFMDDAPSEPE